MLIHTKYISRLNIEQCVYELGRQTYIDDDDDNDDDGGYQGFQDVFQRPTKARKLGMPTFFDDGNDNLDADGDGNAYEEDEEGPAIFQELTVCA